MAVASGPTSGDGREWSWAIGSQPSIGLATLFRNLPVREVASTDSSAPAPASVRALRALRALYTGTCQGCGAPAPDVHLDAMVPCRRWAGWDTEMGSPEGGQRSWGDRAWADPGSAAGARVSRGGLFRPSPRYAGMEAWDGAACLLASCSCVTGLYRVRGCRHRWWCPCRACSRPRAPGSVRSLCPQPPADVACR